jgi:hypothetical protein
MDHIMYNGRGFNTEYIKSVSLGEFVDRHRHLWPEKKAETVEKDLRAIWHKVHDKMDKMPAINSN